MSESSSTQEPASTSAPTAPTAQAAAQARVRAQVTESVLASKKKRKAADDRDDDDDPSSFRWYGRNLVRNCTLYDRIHPIVEFGVKYEMMDEDDRPVWDQPNTEDFRTKESWDIIKATIPNFADDMIDLGGGVPLRKQVCAQIQGGVQGARGDDCGGFKEAALDWLLPPPPPSAPGQDPSPLPVLDPPIPPKGSKAFRGQNHAVTAAALRPLSYPDTKDTYDKIKAGHQDFKILGRQLPAFMFAWGQVYDKNDVEAGYLEGHTMRAAVRHVYLGPSAALAGPDSERGKAGNAAINGTKALTGRDIAYIACQLRFAISSMESWKQMDREFSYREFYWKIVDSLRGEEGQAILDRFNLNVFGSLTTSNQSAASISHVPDEFELLQQQRAAKRARLAEAAAAGGSA